MFTINLHDHFMMFMIIDCMKPILRSSFARTTNTYDSRIYLLALRFFISPIDLHYDVETSSSFFPPSRHSLSHVLYLNGMLILSSSFDGALSDQAFVPGTLHQPGFLVNTEKSVWTPTQSIDFLGHLDSVAGTLSLPVSKFDTINQLWSKLLKAESVRLRDVSVTLGYFAYCTPTIPFV